MADYNLGTARGTIEIEYKGDGARQARQDLGATATAADRSSDNLKKASNASGAAGLVIAGGFALAARSAASFEERLSAISAVSGATDADMERVRGKALQLGKDTKFSASESAEAMEELIKAGLSVEDVLNGAADATVALAAAGAVDMPTAATIASNAMNQFNLGAKDMVGVVDNIAGAANASAIDVNEFGMSLSQVGAVANLAGVDFKDTATAIALMGNAGIKGSDAGTSLKTMLQNLQPVTDKQKELFRDLGITTKDGTNRFYDAEGSLRSLADVSGILNKSLKGMTDQQKQATLETIFGSDAIRAAAVLTDAGAKGFRNMSAEMNKVSAADVAAKRMDNFKGSLEQFQGSLETVGITIGTLLLPALRTIVDALNDLLSAFLSLPGEAQAIIAVVIGLMGALLLVAAGVMKFILFTKALQVALAGTRLAFLATWVAALGPIGLVIAAVAAVVAIIVLLWKRSETFRNIVTAVWNGIKTAVQAVVNWFTGPFLSAITGAWNAVVNVIRTVFGVIVSVITTYINIWRTIITTALNAILAVWRGVWGLFGPLVVAVFNFIKAVIGLVLAIVVGIVRAQINLIRAVVTRVWAGIRAVTSAVWNAIAGIIRAVWSRIVGAVSGPLRVIRSAISAAWNGVRTLTSSIWNNVVKVIADKIGSIVAKVRGIAGKIKSAIGNTGSMLYNAGKEIIQGLINGIAAMFNSLTKKVHQMTSIVKKALPGSPVEEGPLRTLNDGHAGKEIVSMVARGVESESPELRKTLYDVLTLPEAALSDLAALSAAAYTPVVTGPGAPSSATSTAVFPNGMRIQGDLTLRDGKAYISGIALETIDNEDSMAATRARMGGTP